MALYPVTYGDDQMAFYLDARELGRRRAPSGWQTSLGTLWLGGNFSGWIDEFRISDVVRTAEEIEASYY